MAEDFVFLVSSHPKQRMAPDTPVEGKFYKVKDLVWEDSSGIFANSEMMKSR